MVVIVITVLIIICIVLLHQAKEFVAHLKSRMWSGAEVFGSSESEVMKPFGGLLCVYTAFSVLMAVAPSDLTDICANFFYYSFLHKSAINSSIQRRFYKESIGVSWPAKLSLSFDLQPRPHRCAVSLFGRSRPSSLPLLFSVSTGSPGTENLCYAGPLCSRVVGLEAWSALTIQHPGQGPTSKCYKCGIHMKIVHYPSVSSSDCSHLTPQLL